MTNLKQFRLIDYIKTEEDIDNLLEAYTEPYKLCLETALEALNEIAHWATPDTTKQFGSHAITAIGRFADKQRKMIIKQLEKEGIKHE